MLTIIRFILLTLLLAAGVFLIMAVPSLTLPSVPFANSVLWFLSTFLIGAGLALVVKYCGRGALILAVPIAVLSANAIVIEIWPPQIKRSIFRAFTEVAKRDDAYRKLRKQLLPVSPQKLALPVALQQGWDHGLRKLDVANGLEITLFATGLVQPHGLAVSDDGVLFASLPKVGQVVALIDNDQDGVVDTRYVFASGLDRPSGLAFKNGLLYAVTASKLVSLPDANRNYVADAQHVLCDELPVAKQHWAHALVVGADKHLYLSVGAKVDDNDWRQAAVLRVLTDGTTQLFATGLYDCQGLAVHPLSGSLWGTDNSPETLGFHVHPDELNVIIAHGDYGWPFCYGNRLPDAELGSVEICQSTQQSLAQLHTNSIPRGLAFGASLQAPAQFKSMLYMALQGSDFGKREQGFRLMGIPLDADGRILGWGIDLVSGWSVDGKPWGQPTDCVVGGDGCMYVSDSLAGCIYRISFE